MLLLLKSTLLHLFKYKFYLKRLLLASSIAVGIVTTRPFPFIVDITAPSSFIIDALLAIKALLTASIKTKHFQKHLHVVIITFPSFITKEPFIKPINGNYCSTIEFTITTGGLYCCIYCGSSGISYIRLYLRIAGQQFQN